MGCEHMLFACGNQRDGVVGFPTLRAQSGTERWYDQQLPVPCGIDVRSPAAVKNHAVLTRGKRAVDLVSRDA